MMSRILALDYGSKRVGVAISDPEQKISLPRDVLQVASDAEAISQIADMISADDVTKILVGLPRRQDGSEGPMAASARSFAEQLNQLQVPVELFDERFTSRRAHQMLQGLPGQHRKSGKVDTTAAVVLLQDYLSSPHGK